MLTSLDLAGAFDLLAAGHTMVLPTEAAAAALRTQFHQEQARRGRKNWRPARALTWERWTEALWHPFLVAGLDDRILLNPMQEKALWSEVAPSVGVSAAYGTALHSLARQACASLQLAADYDLLSRLEGLSEDADKIDARHFARWYRAFALRCRANRLLPRAHLLGALGTHLQSGPPAEQTEVHLAMGGTLRPAQLKFLDACEYGGITVCVHALHDTRGGMEAWSVEVPGTPDDELRWAVRWTQVALRSDRSHCASPQEPVRIGLVLPDPEGDRASLESLLREYVAPELEAISTDLSSAPWHFTTGPSLLRENLISHAVLLLHWLVEEQPLESVSDLLLSPYLTHSDGWEERARFAATVLRKGSGLRPEIDLPALLSLAHRDRLPGADLPSVTLPAWHKLQHRVKRQLDSNLKKSYGHWARQARSLLQVVGWPGPAGDCSASHRLRSSWDAMLDKLSSLDLLRYRVTFRDFLEHLTRELRELPVDDGREGAPVHLLTAEQTEGQWFDAVLVLHGTDTHWPAGEKADPLLSWTLQRRMGMPGSSAELTNQASGQPLAALRQRTPRFLMTWASHSSQGAQRRTDLVDTLGLSSIEATRLLAPEQERPPVALVTEPDLDPVPPLPSAEVAGGARVLELQANCGFHAFASLRLGSAAPEVRPLGYDPRESGQDLHRALEIFWSALPSQAALRALPLPDRRTAVRRAVSQAMQPRRAVLASDDHWTRAYLQAAENRLASLMSRWLDHELAREDFTVGQNEEKRMVDVGPLRLHVRPDRVDEVRSGHVYIDYKSALDLSTDDWLGERPRAPQLPLYALLTEPDQLQGLAFGRVRAGREMGWITLQAEAGLFPAKGGKVTGDLATQVTLWQQELARLAQEFAEGAAFVDPKAYPTSCQYCQQRLLCRLDAATLLAATPTGPEPAEVDPDR